MASPKDEVLRIARIFSRYDYIFSGYMRYYGREWLEALKEDILIHNEGGPEPDWLEYGKWINKICEEDEYPPLFKYDDSNIQT